MADETNRTYQYSYGANSNLVIQREGAGPRESGPTGEVETLSSKSATDLVKMMGDRAIRNKPKELEEKLVKSRDRAVKRAAERDHEEYMNKRHKQASSVLEQDVNTFYRPKTRETQTAYDVLLNFIQMEMGGQPHDVIRSCAEEVIQILKNDRTTAKSQKKEVESLLSGGRKALSDERFTKLINIGRKITDFSAEAGAAVDDEENSHKPQISLNEDMGVPVVFEEDESDEDIVRSDAEMSEEEEDQRELDLGSATRNRRERSRQAMDKANITTRKDDDVDLVEEASELDVRELDAHWLQRQLSTHYNDPIEAQQNAEAVFRVLCENSARECENELVQLLDVDKFELIKLLIRNKDEVVYCLKLARAEPEEKAAIEEEMKQSPKLSAILEALHLTRGTAADRTKARERNLIREAQTIRRDKAKAKNDEGVEQAMEMEFGEGAEYLKNRPKMLVDLESLSFNKGSHFMSNTKWKLPAGSWKQDHKGYQEFFVPSLTAPPMDEREQVTVASMHSWMWPAFAFFERQEQNKEKIIAGDKSVVPSGMLNQIQSKVYKTAVETTENMLVCAPTGAGKTVVAMLTMMREIGMHRDADTGELDLDGFKIVYVAPMKSLVREMVMSFSERFKPYGIAVRELSGDAQLTKQQIRETQIIVTTPEKWDIVTRKGGERTYSQFVTLVIIDEIHLLHDNRGPVLESIVARTVRQVETTQDMIRLVALSATLPNFEDVATFMRVNPERGLFFFGNGYRPVPLQQRFIGVTVKRAFRQYQLMNEICYERALESVKNGNQVLIFVHSRKETGNTAKLLLDKAVEEGDQDVFLDVQSASRGVLSEEVEGVKSDVLKEIMPSGFACHHAGMSRADRSLVEDLFFDNHIKVLVSTATLAWGVNLPAHTVIIKGTKVYDPEKGQWTELSMLDVMQMLGRAGRPGLDTSGEGMILTTHNELKYYMSLLNEQLPIESQMIPRLADMLCAEAVLGTVRNVTEAVEWMRYTYLYVRMLVNPELYGVPLSAAAEDAVLEQRRVDLAHTAAVLLDKANLLKYDRRNGTFQVTDLGRVAAHYYITHESMAVFNEYMKPTMSDIEIFRVFSLADEFKYVSVREDEKQELAKLLDKVPIPVKESIEEPSAKVNVLLQAYISRLSLDGYALLSDMVYVTQSAGRLMRALFAIALERGWAQTALRCLSLCLQIQHRMWAIESPLRQFPKALPADIIRRIEKKEFAWDRFFDLKPNAIGELIRFPKMGKKVHQYVHYIPKVDLTPHIQPITRTVLRVELTIEADFQWNPQFHGTAEPFWIICEDVDGETILHYEYFVLKQKFYEDEHTISFTVRIYDPLPPQYFVRVVSDRWLGSESVHALSFRNLILPEKYPPPTELLDLQPLPVTALEEKEFYELYAPQFKHFNPIQTQVFRSLFHADDNVFLAAPTGSGKTLCAEFALMRMLSKYPNGRCVYVAPIEALCEERYLEWKEKFGSAFGVRVVQLTGDNTTDLKLLATGQVVISTPERWDVISRRWRMRKNVQNVNLFLVDELHLIGGSHGPTLEVIVSRMRYIAEQTKNPIRIVGLSTSIANAKDIGEWIGAKHTYNFHPNVRPVPLETYIQGFDISNYEARQLAMTKPTFSAITQRSSDKPALVFVSSRKHAKRLAVELMNMAAAEGKAKRFLHVDSETLEKYLEPIRDPYLKETLRAGVGFYHDRLNKMEQNIIKKLFDAEAVQVMVATHDAAWGMSMTAHMVVVMDTLAYSGAEHRYVDYPITQIIQMMGRACRPRKDQSGMCLVMCHTPKKEFYKKFLFEPFPVESHLDHFLPDHVNAETVTKTIENFQDAVDYLTWTFLYRRLTQNPNYYNLHGTSHRHLSDHLSVLVESTLEDLDHSKCIAIEDDSEITSLNLGMIAAYYYIRTSTVEVFATALSAKRKLKGLLKILSSASEFAENVPVRQHEDQALKQLAMHLPLKIDNAKWTESSTKANVLLQAHFCRLPLKADVAEDRDLILKDALRLLQAMVDVISSNNWLHPALAAMELSQMITQGVWDSDSPLLQLPHFTKEMAAKCKAAGVDGIFDLLDLEDDKRDALLKVNSKQMGDIARVCNSYPNVDIKFTVDDPDDVTEGSGASVVVELERDEDEDDEDREAAVPSVYSPRYPKPKTEGWWIVLGDPKTNHLFAIKRLSMKKNTLQTTLDFTAPKEGSHELMIYLMSDCYLGCDQEYAMPISVGAKIEEMSDSEEDAEQE